MTVSEPATDLTLPSGFTARAIEPDADSEAITDLCNLAAVAEYGTPDATVQMVRESYNSPSFQPQRHGRLIVDWEGRPAGVVEFYDQDAEHVARPACTPRATSAPTLGSFARDARSGPSADGRVTSDA